MGSDPGGTQQITIQLDQQGQIVDPADPRAVLQRLALELSDTTHLPLEVGHVQRALQLAVQAEAISAGAQPILCDANLTATLTPFARTAFQDADRPA